jgi:hypothetical protein
LTVSAWEVGLGRTADALTELVAHRRGGTTPPLDLDVAITGRAAVLACAGTVLRDLAPRTFLPPPAGWLVPMGLLDRDPLRALGIALMHRPRPALRRSPSELLDAAAPHRGVTAAWAATGREALLADRAWSARATRMLPPDDAWRAVEGIASMVEAVAVLDHDLAAVAKGRADIASVLDAGQGLGLIARRVGDLAADPVDRARDVEAEPRPRRGKRPSFTTPAPLVAQPPDLIAQARRLPALLGSAAELSPAHIRGAAAVGRDLAILAAAAATGADGHDLRAELGAVARHLNAVVSSDHGEFKIRRTGRQHALDLALVDVANRTRAAFATKEAGRLGAADADVLAQLLPVLVERVATQAHTQVAEQRWAVPNRAEGETLAYTFASSTDTVHRPPLLDHLDQARDAARGLRARTKDSRGNPSRLARAGAVHACDQLRDAVRSRGDQPWRMPTPFDLPPESILELGP